MKKFMILLLTLFNINQSNALEIQDMYTPVDWSYSAVYNTFFDLHKNETSTIEVAHRIALDMYLFAAEARSLGEICDEYEIIAESVEATPYESLLKTYTCNEITHKLIEYHNNQIQLYSQLEPIDASDRNKQVYWLTPAISYGCNEFAKTWVNVHDRPTPGREVNFPEEEKNKNQYAYNVKSEGYFYINDNEKQGAYNARYSGCMDMLPQNYLYNSANVKWSINQLEDWCKTYIFSPDFHSYCTIMVNAAIAHHNELVQSAQ